MTRPLEARADVVVCGGGIAGGAMGAFLARQGLDVVVLEFQDAYRDFVRGEVLSPWGVGETHRMGISDLLYAAEPSLLHTWIRWDEIYEPDEAPRVDLLMGFVNGVRGPLAIHHYRTCQAFAVGAAEAGASVMMGVRNLVVERGAAPAVEFDVGGRHHRIGARLVIGAAGRHGFIGKQVGLPLSRSAHHWGGGLAVEGLHEWPAGVQAMGTEDDRMFFVIPQQHGRARLYLNYPTENAKRYSGPAGTERFLADFDLRCLPLRDLVLDSKPIGRCMTSPSYWTWMEVPYTEGVVLIGDEAGTNDSVLGTGLASALRDVRVVGELLLENENWTPDTFESYRVERVDRMRRLHFAARLLATLSAEFGDEARERRKRAWERMQANPDYMVTLVVAMAGPEQVPDFAYSDFLVERLLSEPKQSRRDRPRFLAGAGKEGRSEDSDGAPPRRHRVLRPRGGRGRAGHPPPRVPRLW